MGFGHQAHFGDKYQKKKGESLPIQSWNRLMAPQLIVAFVHMDNILDIFSQMWFLIFHSLVRRSLLWKMCFGSRKTEPTVDSDEDVS